MQNKNKTKKHYFKTKIQKFTKKEKLLLSPCFIFGRINIDFGWGHKDAFTGAQETLEWPMHCCVLF